MDEFRLIKEQEEKFEANEKRIRELQKDLSSLREQLPTEDVKKQIADLEAEIKEMKENRVIIEKET